MDYFGNDNSLGTLANYSTKISQFWLNKILRKKLIRLSLLIIIWGGITLLSFFTRNKDNIIYNKVIIKNTISIFINNSIVFSILFLGYEFYGITTLIVAVSNSIFIGSKVIPAIINYISFYPKILIFVILEILPYLIGSYVGFSDGNVKHKRKLYILCLLSLLISAFFENIALKNITFKLNEIL